MAVERKTFVVKGRLSFPAVFEPRVNVNEKGEATKAFEAQLIVRKDEPSLAAMAEQCAALLKDKYGKSPVPPNIKRGIREGAEKPNISGMSDEVVFFTAKSKHKPPVVDAKKVGITDPEQVYGGCWVKLAVTPYFFDQPMNKGVSFSLEAVQKIGDDEHFGNVADPDALFAEEDFIPGPTAGSASGW